MSMLIAGAVYFNAYATRKGAQWLQEYLGAPVTLKSVTFQLPFGISMRHVRWADFYVPRASLQLDPRSLWAAQWEIRYIRLHQPLGIINAQGILEGNILKNDIKKEDHAPLIKKRSKPLHIQYVQMKGGALKIRTGAKAPFLAQIEVTALEGRLENLRYPFLSEISMPFLLSGKLKERKWLSATTVSFEGEVHGDDGHLQALGKVVSDESLDKKTLGIAAGNLEIAYLKGILSMQGEATMAYAWLAQADNPLATKIRQILTTENILPLSGHDLMLTLQANMEIDVPARQVGVLTFSGQMHQ